MADVKRGKALYCSRTCSAAALCKPLPELLWPYVEKRENGCWIWTGATRNCGYGVVQVRRGTVRYIAAHRLAYELTHGPIPDEMMVLHNCPGGDNPACCNPDHLWLGTHIDNMRDMREKGRQATGNRTRPETRARGDRHGFRLHPELIARGERNGSAKLTEVQVQAIRLLHQHGEYSFKAIAKLFGVSDVLVARIVRREAWAHVA